MPIAYDDSTAHDVLGSVFFVSRMRGYTSGPPEHVCQLWAMYTSGSCLWLTALLMTNLMLRVWIWKEGLHNPHQVFSPSCDMTFQQCFYTAIFSIEEFFTEGIPVFLILRRSSKISSIIRESAEGTRNLVRLVRRGGIVAWSTIVFLAVIENIVAIYRKNKGTETQQVFFPLFVTLASCGGCRLFLQLRRSNATSNIQAGQEPSHQFELNTYDSAWDARTITDHAHVSATDSRTHGES
ncbi:hypothetical protein P691DRAFT_838417 [Macrolepiota fuliginosa MF-IS2]|uniref:Uncharacterized protein n=1 Tax=Macrolepiota fuliginosa MF-IS2 TaxID=1400762 RepID=A0A9P5X6N9_9AGAR|nr:hypothetical protein P691DRAFT_838417 [Macrolepiota fuliginosa MF-IS2]